MSCGCSGLNDPYNRLTKTVRESALYNFTFPTTITSINTFYYILNSATSTSTLNSLTMSTPAVSGCVLQTTISQGWDFSDYTIVTIYTDANGQIRERYAYLIVRDPLNTAGESISWGGNLVNF